MKTVYKYPIVVTDHQVLPLPKGARPLHAAVQDGSLCLWVLVDTDMTAPGLALRERHVYIHGTGHAVTEDPRAEYLCTFMMRQGTLVFHVFVAPEES